MVEDLRRLGTISRSPEGRTGPASPRSAAVARIQDLRWLRQWVLERLDSLESLARQRPAAAIAGGGFADLERTLEERLGELEEARRRLGAEAERQKQEWSASLTRLDGDRRLLAEAWERVERHRIESLGGSEGSPQPHVHGQGPPRGTPATLLRTAAPAPAPARSPAADSEPNNPVAQAILRQFQTLCRDVRSNAETRRDSP